MGSLQRHPFCLFSNQKRSPFLTRSNWSRIMAEKTGPGPSVDSSKPPGKSSSFEMSPPYSSATSRSSYRSRVTFNAFYLSCCPWIHLVRGCRWDLRVVAAELRINFFKRLYRRQIQSPSRLCVALQTKVSPSLDGQSHQICAAEPQRSIHEVCESGSSVRRVMNVSAPTV